MSTKASDHVFEGFKLKVRKVRTTLKEQTYLTKKKENNTNELLS